MFGREKRSRKQKAKGAEVDKRRRDDDSRPGVAYLKHYINGKFVDSKTDKRIDVQDPSTEKIIATIPVGDARDAQRALKAAYRAHPKWNALPAWERAKFLLKMAEVIRNNREQLARILATEQAKAIGLAQVEVDVTADYFDYNAHWARRIEGEVVESDRKDEKILFLKQPFGVVVGICPWNFPLFVAARKIAPSLVTGNCCIVKSSQFTPHTVMEFTRLVHEHVGLPKGVMNIVNGTGRGELGTTLVSHPCVGVLSLTGSVGAGQAIMKAAATNVTKVSLELGGKGPCLVMADADLDLAAKAVWQSRVLFGGQICNCAERVYVVEAVADKFEEKLTALFKNTRLGDPWSGADYCSQIHEGHMKQIDAMVQNAVKEGAKVLTGGKRATQFKTGFYYEPTLMTVTKNSVEIMQEEVFGPVLPMMRVRNFDEAVRCANECKFGLASSIFTKDYNLIERAQREMQFGEVYVNREHFEAIQGYHAGWKMSGIGGADGKHGVEEFLQSKVVYIQADSTKGDEAELQRHSRRHSLGGAAGFDSDLDSDSDSDFSD